MLQSRNPCSLLGRTERYLFRLIHFRVENAGLIAEHEKVPRYARFDRSRWIYYNFRHLTLSGFSDAHLPHPIYGGTWSSIRDLLRLLFTPSTYAWCERYRNGFLQTFPNNSVLLFHI